uniref:Uncharacterized protein n=1 Tax=Arundo donax TaxID=35708 RepID=A0A0A9E2X6_ARUDO
MDLLEIGDGIEVFAKVRMHPFISLMDYILCVRIPHVSAFTRMTIDFVCFDNDDMPYAIRTLFVNWCR